MNMEITVQQDVLNQTILLVDQDKDELKQISGYLKEGGYRVYQAQDGNTAIDKLRQHRPSIMILDLRLPEGLDALTVMRKTAAINPEVPVIIIASDSDYAGAIEALKFGACDFLTKPVQDYALLGKALANCHKQIKKALEIRRYREHLESEVHAKTTSLITQLSERRKVDRALRRSELRFQSVVENATDIICTLSTSGMIQSMNSAFTRLTGLSGREWLSKQFVALMHEEDKPVVKYQLLRALHGQPVQEQECRIMLADGGVKVGELIASPLLEQSEVVGVLIIIRDITDRKQAEEEKQRLQMELLQAQKLESIGRLAGGVAHDFNNALTAILGFSELALSELPRAHPIREYVEVIKDAGEKAATLTKQLLAFGRKQILRVEQVCLNSVVLRMGRMLQRLICDDVVLHIETESEPSAVLADSAQIEQIIMNLVINARDAMPKGGELWVSTKVVDLTQEQIKQDGVKPGRFIQLRVRDIGAGMSEEAQQRIFEPFYTTKDPGKGTGLGLATVFGVLRQHNGFITCQSELNAGSTFDSYLPIIDPEAIEDLSMPATSESLRGGDEVILVVDDEPAIRRLLCRVLRKLGYSLLQASSGEEALEIAEHQSIDLLLTDMVMPGINGTVLAERLQQMYPDVATLYMSGYAQQTIDNELAIKLGQRFIQKPLKPFFVAQKIREILELSTDVAEEKEDHVRAAPGLDPGSTAASSS